MHNQHSQEAAEIRRVLSSKATERPDARRELTARFSVMSADDKRAELARAREAVDNYDPADLGGECWDEDPLLRQHRIRMETVIEILSADATLA